MLEQYPAPSLSLASDFPKVSRTSLVKARTAMREGVTIAPAIKAALVDVGAA